jgi:oligopeptide transport system permease protein
MWRVVGERLLWVVPTLFLIVAMAFVLMRLTPGGPFDAERALPPEIEANLRAAYGLDKPLHEQFISYVAGLARGDFGPSFKYKDFSVSELIAQGAPVSATIGGLALALAVVLGVFLGTIAALRQNSAVDSAVMGLSLAGTAVPSFVTAPILSLVFGVALGWLPVAGWGDGSLRNLVLPVIALALPQVATLARLTRASMIETLRANHVRTARAKGLSQRLIIWRHAMPAAMLPVVSYLGPAAAGLLTGSVVIETVFGLPGIGRYFVQGALNRDYTLVLGVVVLYACLLVLFNLIVDLAYGWLDPRIRRR